MHVDSQQPGYTVYKEKSFFDKALTYFKDMPTFRPVSIAAVFIGGLEALTAAQEMIQGEPESALYHGLVALGLAGLSRVADKLDDLVAQPSRFPNGMQFSEDGFNTGEDFSHRDAWYEDESGNRHSYTIDQ